jgi:hypothetical protein
LTNFPDGKQTQESLKNGFPKSEFRKINMALKGVEFSNLIRTSTPLRLVPWFVFKILNMHFINTIDLLRHLNKKLR